MSIMRCPACERFVDTDFETGEEVKGQWLCDRCAAEQDDDGLDPGDRRGAFRND